MTYNGKDLVEMLPETWDGKSRRMLVWDDTSKKPLEGIVVGYYPEDNCWMAVGGPYSDGCKWEHCAEIPEKELRIGIKPKYDFMFNILSTKETPKEEPNQEHSIDEMLKILTAYKEGKRVEYRFKGNRIWLYTQNPSWDWTMYEYRVNPESAATAKAELNTKIKSVKKTRRLTNRELSDLMATGNVEKCYPYNVNGRDITKVYRTHSYYRNKEDSPCAKSILIRYAGTKEWVKPLIEE